MNQSPSRHPLLQGLHSSLDALRRPRNDRLTIELALGHIFASLQRDRAQRALVDEAQVVPLPPQHAAAQRARDPDRHLPLRRLPADVSVLRSWRRWLRLVLPEQRLAERVIERAHRTYRTYRTH